MPENLKGVCRLCLSKEGFMFPIFRKDTKSQTPFRVKLLCCASIEVYADDELPSEVCHVCAHQVEKSFEYRTIWENSDATLRSQLHQETSPLLPEEDVNSVHKARLETTLLQSDWSNKNDKKCDDRLCFPEYKNHNSEDSDVGVFICLACSLSFNNSDALIKHLGKNHPEISLYPCKPCKLYFSKIHEYRVHLNLKHALNCNKCDHVFKYRKNLDLHLKSHLSETYACQHCKKYFTKEIDLKQHELSHLNKVCSTCCKIFSSKEEYEEHASTCSGNSYCKFCNQNFQWKKDLIEHVNTYHENSNKCKLCGIVFEKWSEFQKHSCNTLANKSFQCKYCQQSFTESPEFEAHVASEHGEESLSCKFCAKSFTLKSALRRHEKSHSGVKPYQCKYCPRKFKDNSTCIVHIRTHTGEHPFQCQECHKDFKQLANLKMHTYRHHKINDKITEEKTEIIGEAEQIYDQLYATSMIETYSPDGKSFEQIESDISTTFTESASVLLRD